MNLYSERAVERIWAPIRSTGMVGDCEGFLASAPYGPARIEAERPSARSTHSALLALEPNSCLRCEYVG